MDLWFPNFQCRVLFPLILHPLTLQQPHAYAIPPRTCTEARKSPNHRRIGGFFLVPRRQLPRDVWHVPTSELKVGRRLNEWKCVNEWNKHIYTHIIFFFFCHEGKIPNTDALKAASCCQSNQWSQQFTCVSLGDLIFGQIHFGVTERKHWKKHRHSLRYHAAPTQTSQALTSLLSSSGAPGLTIRERTGRP